MERLYTEKANCSGCGACCNVCAGAAVVMRADEEGFLYPEIDAERCFDCGRCLTVCPLREADNFKSAACPVFYVARHKDKEVLQQSTSGGAFTALSDVILRQGGVVYGADYDRQLRVVHRRAETKEQRDRMRISKYVQSEIGDSYAQVKRDLEQGRNVLFSGTPCQTAGLRGFLADAPLAGQLFSCDLICHSIPSPLIWEEYKRLLEEESGQKLAAVQFRSKKDGWSRANSNRGFLFRLENEAVWREDDRFYELFFKVGAITRPSCAACRFTDLRRASDLTIADYWGIEKYSPEWFDPLGVSVVLLNSPQGAALFAQACKDLLTQERPQEESLNEQKRLSESVRHPAERELFWAEYREVGFAELMKRYSQGVRL